MLIFMKPPDKHHCWLLLGIGLLLALFCCWCFPFFLSLPFYTTILTDSITTNTTNTVLPPPQKIIQPHQSSQRFSFVTTQKESIPRNTCSQAKDGIGNARSAIDERFITKNIIARTFCNTGKTFLTPTHLDSLLQRKGTMFTHLVLDTPIMAFTTPVFISVTDSQGASLLLEIGTGIVVTTLITTFAISGISIYRRYHTRHQKAAKHKAGAVRKHTDLELFDDNILTITNSFQSIMHTINNNNQTIFDQMNHLLTLSDISITTINLEQLLSEFVTRIGTTMKVKHVAFLLYGTQQKLPWAVAHWSDTVEDIETQPLGTRQRQAIVYIDPSGDIASVSTKKLGTQQKSSSPYNPIHVPAQAKTTGIPQHAIRKIDTILAEMVMHQQKVMYNENIQLLPGNGAQEHWLHTARTAGYGATIAVPLRSLHYNTGAFLLYAAQPRSITATETFLLNTAALQLSMALENVLLFAEVKEKNNALERANQLKSQFLANVTHELRTPLHSIISYGAFMLDGFVDGELTREQTQHIHFMVRRAEDLSHLVDDMLDLSKIEADKIEMRLAPLTLTTILADVVEELTPLAKNKGLTLQLQIENHLPQVWADKQRIRQVMVNLVSNAIKFTDHGNVTIRCNNCPYQMKVAIKVEDTGIGISPLALGSIFEAFRQADESTTRQFGGTGLGLTIAKKLLELHNTAICVESSPGMGSIFSFALPIAIIS